MRVLLLMLGALRLACRHSDTARHDIPAYARVMPDSQSMDTVQRIFHAYDPKRISADVAAKALLDVGHWSIEADSALQEAIVREPRARRKLRRDSQ